MSPLLAPEERDRTKMRACTAFTQQHQGSLRAPSAAGRAPACRPAAARPGRFSTPAPRFVPKAAAGEKLRHRSFMGQAMSAAWGPRGAPAAPAARQPLAVAASGEVVAVTGATGFVGSRLVEALVARGDVVRVLSRNPVKARKKLGDSGSLEFVPQSQWQAAVAGSSAVVNLAGEPISTRWTPEIKREIKRSRVLTTRKLVEAINACEEGSRPEVLINGSALGFYGVSDTAVFDESSPSGNDFLAEVCRDWEGEASKARGTRVVLLRTGIVLEKDGGALQKMLPAFQAFAGGTLGRGQQWFSWIHRDDLVGMIIAAIGDEKWEGPVNGTAPSPVTMAEACSAIGGALGRPSWLPVPEFAVQTLLGEGASLVLDGQKVLPNRALELNYQFKYMEIESAVAAIV